MPIYLVETYLAHGDTGERADRERRARRAAAELPQQAESVRFIELLHLPDDEMCLVLFEAPSSDLVELAARRAGINPLRVVCAISPGDGTPPT